MKDNYSPLDNKNTFRRMLYALSLSISLSLSLSLSVYIYIQSSTERIRDPEAKQY